MESQNTENNALDNNNEKEPFTEKEDLKTKENETVFSDEIYRKNIEQSILNVYQDVYKELLQLKDQIDQLEKRQYKLDELYSKNSYSNEDSYPKEAFYHQVGKMAIQGLIIITVTLFYVSLEWLTAKINISSLIVGISGILMLCTIINQLFREDFKKIRNLLFDDLYNDKKHLNL